MILISAYKNSKKTSVPFLKEIQSFSFMEILKEEIFLTFF